jgi:hypothetical protein
MGVGADGTSMAHHSARTGRNQAILGLNYAENSGESFLTMEVLYQLS